MKCKAVDCSSEAITRGLCNKHYLRARSANQLPNLTIEDRFWRRVDRRCGDDCWLWLGADNGAGYGQMTIAQRRVYAHRYSWELHNGPIPAGLQVDHMCHNHGCVNPAHLRLTTQSQNNQNYNPAISSPFRGVHRHKASGLWRACVTHQGVEHSAGYFKTPEAAAEAARELRLRLHTHNDADREPTPVYDRLVCEEIERAEGWA